MPSDDPVTSRPTQLIRSLDLRPEPGGGTLELALPWDALQDGRVGYSKADTAVCEWGEDRINPPWKLGTVEEFVRVDMVTKEEGKTDLSRSRI